MMSRLLIRHLLLCVAVSGLWLNSGCETYRIEYIKRPEFYKQASRGTTSERAVADDGTIIVNVYGDEEKSELQRRAHSESKPFLIREESEQGTVTLRALLPEHVLANTLTCLQNEEYDLLWEQLLSERTKVAYSERGQTQDDFASFCQKERRELARTVNRMILGLPRQEVVAENMGHGVIQYRFVPQVAGAFKYRRVQIVTEGFGLKLLLIQ